MIAENMKGKRAALPVYSLLVMLISLKDMHLLVLLVAAVTDVCVVTDSSVEINCSFAVSELAFCVSS